MSDEVSRGRGNGKAAFSSQFPALRAEAAFVAPAFPWSLGPWLDHGTILRRKGVIIGKLGRDQRSGVRDQKRKDLRRRWRGCLGGEGLDRRGGSLGVLGQWGTSRLSPGSEDPMGFAGSGPDLYGYAGNNPISYSDPSGLCTDPGGPGVSYCIDTFIPEQSVWGFAGDNRGPDSNGGSYRTQQFLTQNADGSWNSQYFPGTSSLYLAPKISRPAAGDGCGVTPLSGRKNGSNGFRAHCWASDGLGFGAAPDAGYDLDFTPGPGGPNINGMGTQFPSLEIWQYGGPNGPQLVYYYDSQAAGTGPGDLFPTPWSSPLMPIVH
jgi:hypothetical protein